MTAQEKSQEKSQDNPQNKQVHETTRRASPELRAPQLLSSGGTASLHLTLAVCDYEHVREITQGLVRAENSRTQDQKQHSRKHRQACHCILKHLIRPERNVRSKLWLFRFQPVPAK